LKQTFFLILFFINLANCYQIANGQSDNARPKIGLALSGGGSLGMAHVGVLKVLEEAGLRPDYITGVSMGSIVGAMYSIGYNAETIEYLFRTADWDLILSNNQPEDKVIFTEKKYFNNSIVSLPVSSRKVRLPSGLINGQQIEKTLSYFIWPAADINYFSELPIPFLCIGTDLISTSKVVMKSGYLPDAVRASMAVPSIFTPIKIDTAVIIDGGFVRNIAVTELKEMGADIIIGSYTGFHRYNENELQSVAGVLKQVAFFNSINDYAEEKKLIDILVEPDVKDFSSTIFTNSDSIIQRGYEAASPLRDRFMRLADSLDLLGKQKPVDFILNKRYYTFDKIEVTGNNIISEEQILGVLGIDPGEEVDRHTLNEGIDLLYGRSWFEKVKYRFMPANDSLTLVIECIEKPKGILYGSVHYDNNLNAGIILNLSVKNLLNTRSVVDIESYLAQFYRFRFSYTQFIDRNQRFGLSAFVNADNTMIPVMMIKNETGRFLNRSFGTGINLNKRSGLNHFITISSSYENLTLIPDFISVNQFRKVSYSFINAGIINQYNNLDTKHFPNKGNMFQVSINVSSLLSGKDQHRTIVNKYTPGQPGDFLFKKSWSAAANLRHYYSPDQKLTLGMGADCLFIHTRDTVTSPHNYYYTGGIEGTGGRSFPLSGFHAGEIQVERLASLRFDADWEFIKYLHLNLLTSFAVAKEPGRNEEISFLGGYGLGISYMSIIGPLKVGLMQGFSSNARYFKSIKGYLSIGFIF
jgi:NTE family protein